MLSLKKFIRFDMDSALAKHKKVSFKLATCLFNNLTFVIQIKVTIVLI